MQHKSQKWTPDSSPVSIQTQALALRALRKRKPQETQALAFGTQPIMVATASTEHSYWLALEFVAWKFHASARLERSCAAVYPIYLCVSVVGSVMQSSAPSAVGHINVVNERQQTVKTLHWVVGRYHMQRRLTLNVLSINNSSVLFCQQLHHFLHHVHTTHSIAAVTSTTVVQQLYTMQLYNWCTPAVQLVYNCWPQMKQTGAVND